MTNTTEVMVKPEVLNTPDLELTIESTLKKANVTDAVINALKEKYSGLKLNSVDDKENYLIIKESRKEVRKIAIIAEKICKYGRDEANKVRTLWINKEKEVVGKIEEIQLPLDAEIKLFEDEVLRKEQDEIKRQEEAYMARQTTLLKMEAKYADGCFTLGNVSYDTINIKESPEEVWEDTILPKFQREFDKIETVRSEEIRIKEEAAEKFRQEQELLLKQQQEFKKMQDEFLLQQQELQKQKDDANRLELEKSIKEQAEKDKAKQALQTERFFKMFPYSSCADGLDMTNLWIHSESAFIELLEEKKSAFKVIELERVRLENEKIAAGIEAAKHQAIRDEQDRVAEQKRIDELKQKEIEERKQFELDSANDKTRWAEIIRQLSEVNILEMKSHPYKKRVQILREKLEEINSL